MTLATGFDPRWTLELLRDAVAVPSVTGDEAAFAALLHRTLAELTPRRLDLTEVAPGRPVLTAVLAGDRPGPTLMLVGHLDVVRTDGWEAAWPAADPRVDPFAASERDAAIWGRGSVDVKGGIAAALGALHNVRTDPTRDQVGDVVCAFVCDEESGEPGLGRSLGMAAVARRIVDGVLPRPQAAIYVEPTGLDVITAQIGFLIAEVVVTGRTAYFARPEHGIDALRAARAVLEALDRRADELAAREPHPLCGRPALVVHGMRAGTGTIAVPGHARLELIRTVAPGDDLQAAADDIEALVTAALANGDAHAEVTFPAGRDHPVGGLPFEAEPDAPQLAALRGHAEQLAPGHGRVRGASFWSELSFLDALGIPSAYFAPGDIANAHTPQEHVPVDEVVLAARVLAELLTDPTGPQGATP